MSPAATGGSAPCMQLQAVGGSRCRAPQGFLTSEPSGAVHDKSVKPGSLRDVSKFLSLAQWLVSFSARLARSNYLRRTRISSTS